MKDGQTIGQWLNWDFKTNGDLEIRDKNGRQIYWEDSDKSWGSLLKPVKMKDGQTIGQWLNWDFEANGDFKIYDKRGNLIYFEKSSGEHWAKFIYDPKGEVIYYEDSSGQIKDCRIPEVIEHNGRKYKLIP
jgi:hypothetical protein